MFSLCDLVWCFVPPLPRLLLVLCVCGVLDGTRCGVVNFFFTSGPHCAIREYVFFVQSRVYTLTLHLVSFVFVRQMSGVALIAVCLRLQ